MSSTAILATLFVGTGVALAGAGLLMRFRRRTGDLAALLDLPYGEQDVDIAFVTERTPPPLLQGAVGFTGQLLAQVDTKNQLLAKLEKARLPVRPAEYVLSAAILTVVTTVFIAAITERWIFGIAAGVAVPFLAASYLNFRIARRKRAIEEQLPEALSVIASSMSAGHTFLRSIQMMCEESEPPLAEEFARVVHETRLGDPLVDSLERMAHRLEISDLVWVVQAIRIQQTVGGKLSELLHSLAEFIRAREEIRREINVLTAEGRASAWVLGALPIGLTLFIQISSPGYLDPMFRGFGPFVLTAAAASVVTGFLIIRRMVRIDI